MLYYIAKIDFIFKTYKQQNDVSKIQFNLPPLFDPPPALFPELMYFFWRALQFWNHTCVTRLDNPVIWAILSRSWPSGFESIWKLAWRIWTCSSVNVVRIRFVFFFEWDSDSPLSARMIMWIYVDEWQYRNFYILSNLLFRFNAIYHKNQTQWSIAHATPSRIDEHVFGQRMRYSAQAYKPHDLLSILPISYFYHLKSFFISNIQTLWNYNEKIRTKFMIETYHQKKCNRHL